MEAIGINSQRFKVLFLNRIVFLDSAAFLGGTLDSLVQTLTDSNHHFPIMRQWKVMWGQTPEYAIKESEIKFRPQEKAFKPLNGGGRAHKSRTRHALSKERRERHPDRSASYFEARVIHGRTARTDRIAVIDSHTPVSDSVVGGVTVDESRSRRRMDLVKRKGVFAYDFVKGGASQLFRTIGLPKREEFFNTLTQEPCSEEDYEHAQKVFKAFNCTTFLDYSMVYNCSDVYLLCEAVEDMRKRVFNQFGLDMVLFFSFPHMSKQLMLRHTKAQPEMISDYSMADLLRSGIRGGLAYVNQRLIKLHSKRSPTGKILTFLDEACTIPACLVYVDENNL